MPYLPATPGERIGDLRTARHMTRKELAARIGVDPATVSRIESGVTRTINDETVRKLARVFNVSAEFILCETDEPDKTNFDVWDLGLSVQAARNLYTHRVNTEIVNLLLENPRFARLTRMIEQYFNADFAAAFAAQNQLYLSLAGMLRGTAREEPELRKGALNAAQTIELAQTPPYEMDAIKLRDMFMSVLHDIKKDMNDKLRESQAMTKAAVEKMTAELTKGQDANILAAPPTPEQMADAIVHTVEGTDIDPAALESFRTGVASLFASLPLGTDAQIPAEEGNDAERLPENNSDASLNG